MGEGQKKVRRGAYEDSIVEARFIDDALVRDYCHAFLCSAASVFFRGVEPKTQSESVGAEDTSGAENGGCTGVRAPIDRGRRRGFSRWACSPADRTRRYWRRGDRSGEGGKGSVRQRIWLCRCRQEETGLARGHPVPPRVCIEAFYLDSGHAAGRAGQTQFGSRRQRLLGFQDPCDLPTTDHAAQYHDPYIGIR